MYNVTAMVGISGYWFNEMITSAVNYKPDNLAGEDMEQFIEINKSIMEAAKGN